MKTKSHCFFLHSNQFYESKEDGCVLFGDPNVNEAIFIAFEVINKSVEADSGNLTYMNNELKKLHGMFDRRKGDRHTTPREGDRHKTPREGDRHQIPRKDYHGPRPWDRHRNRRVEAISEDIKIDTGMERICCVCAELRYGVSYICK